MVSHSLLVAIDALWRRKHLAILSLILVPLFGAAYATLGPRPYVAKALLLLQEDARDNPLARDVPVYGAVNDRAAGLRTLLKSDRVLRAVMHDLTGEEAPRGEREIVAFTRDLADALTLELVGTEFLLIELEGSYPKGLGKTLEAVLSQFLEAMLPEQDARSAVSVLLERRRHDAEFADAAYEKVKSQLGSDPKSTIDRKRAQLAEIEQRLGKKKLQLAELQRQVRRVVAQEAANQNGRRSPEAQELPAMALSEPVQQVEAEVDRLVAAATAQRAVLSGLADAERRLPQLADEAAKAREAYENYSERYSAQEPPLSAPRLLKAPERMKLLDVPRDPVFPAVSSKKIALITLLMTVLLSVGLVVGAELLDMRVHRKDQLEALTGLPVLVVWPPSSEAGEMKA